NIPLHLLIESVKVVTQLITCGLWTSTKCLHANRNLAAILCRKSFYHSRVRWMVLGVNDQTPEGGPPVPCAMTEPSCLKNSALASLRWAAYASATGPKPIAPDSCANTGVDIKKAMTETAVSFILLSGGLSGRDV